MTYIVTDETNLIRSISNDWKITHGVIEVLVNFGFKPCLHVYKDNPVESADSSIPEGGASHA